MPVKSKNDNEFNLMGIYFFRARLLRGEDGERNEGEMEKGLKGIFVQILSSSENTAKT